MLWPAAFDDVVGRVDAAPCTWPMHMLGAMPCIEFPVHMNPCEPCAPSCNPTIRRIPGGKHSAPFQQAHNPCTLLPATIQLLVFLSLHT